MIIIHVTTYIFVLLLFLLNRLFVVKVWVLYYIYTTAKMLGRIMVWRSRRRLCTFGFGCLTLVLVSSSKYT
jgi:hypothetical protein